MTAFSFATAGRILFGPGSVRRVPGHAAELGRRILLVTGATPDRAAPLAADLDRARLRHVPLSIQGEPEIEDIAAGARLARERSCNLVIGFGGGSAMDAAKAIAALITNHGPVDDYLEVIGKAKPLKHRPAPCIAIPTTAGTGSEVTRNAVLRSASHRVKVSMRSPDMLPTLAVIDPELTLDLPPHITAAAGFDALCQLVEAFVSTRANPLTDGLCRQGLACCARSLTRVVENGRDMAARTDMSLASLFSGLALANAGLGAVHGIAGPLGGMHPAPHGAVCARLLAGITAANIEALAADPAGTPSLKRYGEIAGTLTGDGQATPDMLARWFRQTADAMHIPGLSHWGLAAQEVPQLVDQALSASSMRGNPVSLSTAVLRAVILDAMEGDG